MSNIPIYIRHNDDLLELMSLTFNSRGITFSKTIAAKIVGGEARLERLVINGKIRMEKPTCKQNGKWQCNGGDVLQHIQL